MDQHHSHHYHRTRYAPLPSHHHHNHHHHHHQNPNHLPPPPPPPPPSLPPPPPPPPHHSQFPPNFIEQDRHISNNHHHPLPHPYPRSPRLSDVDPLPRRSIPDFDQPSWNPNPIPSHRVVPPDNRPPRNYPPPVDYDRESHHRSLDRVQLPPQPPPPPYHHQPIEYDHDDGISRFRLEPMDVYESNPREIEREEFLNYHRGRDTYVDPKPEGYVYVYDVEDEVEISRGGSRRDVESKRWVSDRNGPRVPRDSSSFEFGNKEIGAAGSNNGNDFRVVSGKRDYYGNELGRYNNGRGNSRERAHEFTRTPPHKQVQKKSALLRLQTIKPNHRNRENEQSRYPGYAAENNPNFFRGKEQHQAENNSSFFRGKEQHQHGYLGHGHGVKAETREEREGSPVELDISFESNSLVAKAKVAPSSSVVVCDTNNMTPVSDTDLGSAEKRRKVSVSDSECSGLQPAKLSTGSVSLDSSPCKANDTSSSAKDLSLQKNVSDTRSPPQTSVTGNSHDKNKVTLSDGTANVCAEKSSPMVVKKKKIVKRVVKKVAKNPSSTVSNSLSANTLHGTVQTDSVTPGLSNSSGPGKVETCLKEESTTADNVSLTDCLHSLPIEENVLPEDKKEDLSPLRLGPQSRSLDCKTDSNSEIGKLAIFKGGTNISNTPSCVSSSKEDKQIDCDCLDADDSVHDLVGIPHTENDTKSLNESTFSEINDPVYDNKQLCKNEVSLSLGNYSNVGSPQNRYPVDIGDEMNCRLFSSADIIGNTDLIHTCDCASDRVYGLNSNDLTGSEENFTVSESGNVGMAYCENKAPTIIQNAILEENTDSAIPMPSSGIIAISSTGKTMIKEVSDCLQHVSALEQGSDNQSASSEDSMTVQCCDTGKQVSPSDATISPENCDREETLSNLNISVGFDEGNVNVIKKREVSTRLDFLSSKTEGISPDPVNPVSYANDVDRASNLLKGPCSSQVLDQSVQSLDLNSQSSTEDEVTALHRNIEVSEAQFYVPNNGNDNAKKVSRASKKKRKTASHPSFGRRRSELSDAIVVTTSCAEVPTGFIDNQAHDKEGALPTMGVLSIDQSIPHSEHIDKLPDNILVGGSSESIDADRGTMSSEHLELQHSDIASHSLCEDVAIPNVQFSMVQGEQKDNSIPIVPVSSNQTDILVVGNIKGEKTDLQAVEENYQFSDLEQKSPSADMKSNDLNVKDDLLLQQSVMSCHADTEGVTTSNVDNELIDDVPNALSNICSKGTTSEVHARKILNCTASSQVYSKVKTHALNSHGSELNRSKSQPVGVIPKTFQGHSFTFSKSKSNTKTSAPSTHISKARTWCRTSSASLTEIKPSVGTVPPKRPTLKRKGNFQNTSYIRKGNSLVRKPSLVSGSPQIPSANQSPSFGLDELPKNTRSEGGVDVTEPILKTGVTNAPQQRHKTPPAPLDTKSEENISSPLVEPPSIVATDGKALTALSDSYYKKSKNQLVRTTFESRTNQTVPMPNSTVHTDGQVRKVLCNRRFSKRRSHKVAGSSCKPLRASLVWTLRGENSSKNDSETRHYQKVLPHLFPWKRTTYLRGFIHNYASNSNPNSLSAISKKLLLLRKRDTVYTRSTHGFSLWKSKVLGVGGSSLKWSKSIEKHSKQANEQATLAVAAVERKKREQEVTACLGSQAKRERIFRIGSVRYRMDSSRRTLQRISDDEPQSSASTPSGLTAKRAYIPRRLVIGNDEYVRIGNGNQLIRDPKKRTRKLANEKVRWSLHTARQRLARKQKYCQFFTRFGKCNKDGGKCPYIHDSSKIAVCTKFLNGLCSASNCKLTHKVIPERMPDCSYFLQGLCTNKDCPYRHVNVNPKASICEGFLKGYCADGNECRKKHSYVCPAFEATGTCSEGTKCKLHHPKKQSKGKKRKRSEDQSRGRYFGSSPIDASEPGMTVAPRQRQQNDDDLEELPDFIGLDVDDDVDEEIAESADQSFEQAMLCDSDSLDLQLDNFDERIKPVLIMKSESTPQPSQSPASFWQVVGDQREATVNEVI
ncbi:hypothetical protein RIF29_16721 [Crotalaria pallida]|uniref:C3H1-type domain-containing protein n=1 Tax=Crotalaria pallida TaxID=3830 RepID=A0AAN9IDV7_CROPI